MAIGLAAASHARQWGPGRVSACRAVLCCVWTQQQQQQQQQEHGTPQTAASHAATRRRTGRRQVLRQPRQFLQGERRAGCGLAEPHVPLQSVQAAATVQPLPPAHPPAGQLLQSVQVRLPQGMREQGKHISVNHFCH
ncbi:uncharacterized protein LOC126485069 [Schistocerca serialis cubense]|uniref:uncharacterized protein LOC126485069 n=1 Tax=Schistocerca serialis cubense TaxID=2023355 RepID=UPI00214EBEF7|nr:uncharacterized protein LOC126485069 [Schistocerca serialis cubense]